MLIRIHKEGKTILRNLIIAGLLFCLLFAVLLPNFLWLALSLFFISMVFSVQFFRNPERKISTFNNNTVYAPADGKVVVIEEVEEPEFFQEKRLQISIFMNPANVHVNRNPVGGEVKYYKYHPGKYLVAWHPKSSTENERTTSVINNGKHNILVRQIAGAMAKRIVNYLEPGQQVTQGEDMGFIKFGSRVDIFLPLGTKVNVALEEKVKGNLSVIAHL
jgi:phosphatidylserine decarboxylase